MYILELETPITEVKITKDAAWLCWHDTSVFLFDLTFQSIWNCWPNVSLSSSCFLSVSPSCSPYPAQSLEITAPEAFCYRTWGLYAQDFQICVLCHHETCVFNIIRKCENGVKPWILYTWRNKLPPWEVQMIWMVSFLAHCWFWEVEETVKWLVWKILSRPRVRKLWSKVMGTGVSWRGVIHAERCGC